MQEENENRAHALARFMREDPKGADCVSRALLTMAEEGFDDRSGDLKEDLQPYVEQATISAAFRADPDGERPRVCFDAAHEYINENLDSLKSGLREAAALVSRWSASLPEGWKAGLSEDRQTYSILAPDDHVVYEYDAGTDEHQFPGDGLGWTSGSPDVDPFVTINERLHEDPSAYGPSAEDLQTWPASGSDSSGYGRSSMELPWSYGAGTLAR